MNTPLKKNCFRQTANYLPTNWLILIVSPFLVSCMLTTNDLTETHRLLLWVHADEAWMGIHPEKVTNGLKHTNCNDTYLEFTVKMDDAEEMAAELNCSW